MTLDAVTITFVDVGNKHKSGGLLQLLHIHMSEILVDKFSSFALSLLNRLGSNQQTGTSFSQPLALKSERCNVAKPLSYRK